MKTANGMIKHTHTLTLFIDDAYDTKLYELKKDVDMRLHINVEKLYDLFGDFI